MLIHLRFINTFPWDVTETILYDVTHTFVIVFPLNHVANIQKSFDICKGFEKFFCIQFVYIQISRLKAF